MANFERMTNKTAVLKHVFEGEHEFAYTNNKVLTKNNNREKLKFLEMLYINHLDTVNLRSDVEGLSVVYSGLLSKAIQNQRP